MSNRFSKPTIAVSIAAIVFLGTGRQLRGYEWNGLQKLERQYPGVTEIYETECMNDTPLEECASFPLLKPGSSPLGKYAERKNRDKASNTAYTLAVILGAAGIALSQYEQKKA
jgi:hypothetical protein